ncbi:MAG: DEAD/DEAH box helicase family protein [Planctomycetota bacterium]|jgi:hypothetical protein
MSNTKYFPQASDIALEILNHYKAGKYGCLLTAQSQSGKTGAVLSAMERISQEEKKKGNRAVFLYLGPSSISLLQQANERIKLVAEVYLNLVGSQTYHAPHILEHRNSRKTIDTLVKMHMSQGHKVVVVLDEAHIGIGKSKSDLQATPKFFRDTLEFLPYLSKGSGVFSILVTATPFTFDFFVNTDKSNTSKNYPEVYMPPGDYYYGVKSAFDRGNLRQNFQPSQYKNRYQRMLDFEDHLREILFARREETNGYFVFRATNATDRTIIKEACDGLGIPFQTYSQKDNNIQEFADELEKIPNDFRVMAIIRSYGAGKSLCRKNIAGWYEVDTYRGRHEADEYQSIGRNFGYNDPVHEWPSYPIYCNVVNMYKMVKYFDECQEGNFSGKRKIQCSATHTKVKRRRTKNTSLIVADTAKECYEKYCELRPHHQAGFFTSVCTNNNTIDVAKTVINKSVRRKIDGRINVLHLNGSHPDYSQSWNNLPPQFVGKYVIVYESDVPVEEDTRKDKSYLSSYVAGSVNRALLEYPASFWS